MIDYEFCAECCTGLYSRAYVAKIVGRHPQFVLDRVFQKLILYVAPKHIFYRCQLENGLYECCVRHLTKDTSKIAEKKRWWLIVVDGDIYEYRFDEFGRQYALFAAYNVKANAG